MNVMWFLSNINRGRGVIQFSKVHCFTTLNSSGIPSTSMTNTPPYRNGHNCIFLAVIAVIIWSNYSKKLVVGNESKQTSGATPTLPMACRRSWSDKEDSLPDAVSELLHSPRQKTWADWYKYQALGALVVGTEGFLRDWSTGLASSHLPFQSQYFSPHLCIQHTISAIHNMSPPELAEWEFIKCNPGYRYDCQWMHFNPLTINRFKCVLRAPKGELFIHPKSPLVLVVVHWHWQFGSIKLLCTDILWIVNWNYATQKSMHLLVKQVTIQKELYKLITL